METVYLIVGMVCVTFSIRYVLLPFSGRFRFSDRMRGALQYVPPAVLTAIIVPAVLLPNGTTLNFSLDNAYLAGAVATVTIGKISNNLLITIAGGMAFFALWMWGVAVFSL